MVGVAGKSKGCTTCRRRKIRCDQGTPVCANCIRSSRVCEGYERYPVFINHTVEGVQKRKPLEEAKPGAAAPVFVKVLSLGTGGNNGLAGQMPLSAIRLAQTPSTGNVWSTNFISWFWETYSPADLPIGSHMRGPVWLRHAMSITRPTAALHSSLLALSIVRRGRANNDDVLVVEGYRVYGQALHKLRQFLHDSHSASQDETLAAVRALVLYELYEATSTTLASWQSHVLGLASLLESLGPWGYHKPLARAVFEEFRYPLVRASLTSIVKSLTDVLSKMLQYIILRRGSVFANEIWRSAPWQDVAKPKEQEFADCGFWLAGILDETDKVAMTLPREEYHINSGTLVGVIDSTLEFSDALDQFKVSHLQGSHTESDFTPAADQTSLDLELLILNWWAIKWVFAHNTNLLLSKATTMLPCLSPSTQGYVQKSLGSLAVLSSDTARDSIGRSIIESVQEILNRDATHFWMSRAVFPLMVATFHFSQSPPELKLCQEIRTHIVDRQGFKSSIGLDFQPAYET